MLDWVIEKFILVLNYVPEVIVDVDSPNFQLIRAMWGLLLLVLLLTAVATMPRLLANLKGNVSKPPPTDRQKLRD